MIKASGEIGSRSVWLAGLGYVRVVRSLWFVTKCRFESCLAFKDNNNEKDTINNDNSMLVFRFFTNH